MRCHEALHKNHFSVSLDNYEAIRYNITCKQQLLVKQLNFLAEFTFALFKCETESFAAITVWKTALKLSH